jgi:hypothetical protein
MKLQGGCGCGCNNNSKDITFKCLMFDGVIDVKSACIQYNFYKPILKITLVGVFFYGCNNNSKDITFKCLMFDGV